MANRDPQLHNKLPGDPVSVAQRWSDETLLREIDSLLAHEMFDGQLPAVQDEPAPQEAEEAPTEQAEEVPPPQAEETSPPEETPPPEPEEPPAPQPGDDGMRLEDLPDILSAAPQVMTPKPQNLEEPEQTEPAPKKVKKKKEKKKKKEQQAEPQEPSDDGGQTEPESEPEPPPVRTPEEACVSYAAELGSLGLRIVTLLVLELLSVALTLYADMGWSFFASLLGGTMIGYLLLILLILMLALSYGVFSEAFRALSRGEFPQDVLLSLTAVFALVDSFSAAGSGRTPFTAAVGLLLLLRLWGGYSRRSALLGTARLLRDTVPSVGIVEVQLPSDTHRGVTRAKPSTKDFMRRLETRDPVRRVMGVYTPLAVLICLAGAAFITTRAHCGYFWAGTLLLLGCTPTAALMVYERVFSQVAKRLSGGKAALCGWHGASVFGGEHAVLVNDDDLFPPGSLSFNGFKVYQGNPERLIAYAAAAARCSGGALYPLFDELLDAHNGRHYTVDSFRFYDSGGVGAQIMGDVVLLGSLEFMNRMGVHMDGGSKVRQAAYLSLNGELAAVFAFKYTAPDTVKQGLLALARDRHFHIVLATRAFFATPDYLRAKFDLRGSSIGYPPVRDRLRLSDSKLKKTGAQGALLCRDSFFGYAQTIAAGRLLRAAGRAAALLSPISGLIGLGLMALLAVLPAFEAATALNMLLYVLIWLVPSLLMCLWHRSL